MPHVYLLRAALLALAVILLAGCTQASAPAPTPTTAPAAKAAPPTTAPAAPTTAPAAKAAAPTTAPTTAAAAKAAAPTAPGIKAGAKAQIYVLSNSAPHVVVIDGQTEQVVKSADIPGMTTWTWNDDNNYADGKNLWLGMRNADTNDVEAVVLDLDTLQITRRVPLGQDKTTLYIGKPTRDGRLLVSKHASGQVAAIDLKTFEVVKTVDVPVNGGVACDMDVIIGPDGKERAYIPTDNGNTIISLDTATLAHLDTLSIPEGTRPFMLTAAPDGKAVWVQERTSNATVVVDPVSLKLVQRFLVGKDPIVNTFSPDGKVSYTGHNSDIVTANDSATFKELWRTQAGMSAQKLGVHPAGTFVYVILTREGAVAVLDAATGKLTKRIPIGTNPTGIYVRTLPG